MPTTAATSATATKYEKACLIAEGVSNCRRNASDPRQTLHKLRKCSSRFRGGAPNGQARLPGHRIRPRYVVVAGSPLPAVVDAVWQSPALEYRGKSRHLAKRYDRRPPCRSGGWQPRDLWSEGGERVGQRYRWKWWGLPSRLRRRQSADPFAKE